MELLCLDFMNSDARDYLGGGKRTNRLRSAEWLDAFLVRWGLTVTDAPGKATFEMLEELRESMWRVAGRIVELKDPGARDLEKIDAALSGATLRRRLERDGGAVHVSVEPLVRNWNWVASEVASSFAELLAAHDLQRLKFCGNPDCRWVFYDESKNRTRRWCADSCGNLIKVRRFRHRERATRGSS